MEIVRVTDGHGLDGFVRVASAVDANRSGALESYVDWERQADAAEWLVAVEDGGDVVGAGHVVAGWHAPPGVVRVDVRVLAEHRGRGFAEVSRESRLVLDLAGGRGRSSRGRSTRSTSRPTPNSQPPRRPGWNNVFRTYT